MVYRKIEEGRGNIAPSINIFIRNLPCGMFCFAILVLLQGCAVVSALWVTAEVVALPFNLATIANNHDPNPWNVQPVCQLECITTQAELTEIVSTTGLNTDGAEACFSTTEQSDLSALQYCEKSLDQYCERATEKLLKENPLYSQCTVLDTSECVELGDGLYPECKAISWSPPKKRSR